jgi:fucose permease
VPSRQSGVRGAAAAGYASFALLGFSGLLVPSLIRAIERDFGQSDAGIGLLYFLGAGAYVVGSYGGGILAGRVRRKTILLVAVVLQAGGLASQAATSSWTCFFLAAACVRGLGSGAIEGGINAVFLDLFPVTRGRALSLIHLFFSLGALSSPLVVGLLTDGGLPWQVLLLVTAFLWVGYGIFLATVELPLDRASPVGPGRTWRLRAESALVLLGVAIACYVASELGVSNWLVRFLDQAPLSVATFALSLFWGGLTLGRLVSAVVADRFDHVRFATISATAASSALLVAIFAPSLPVSIALFGLVGFAFGPVYPLIVAIGGELFPGRSSSVGGFLAGTSVVGAIVYPPVVGLVSVSVGLSVAMVGTALLGFACAAALVVASSILGHRQRAR